MNYAKRSFVLYMLLSVALIGTSLSAYATSVAGTVAQLSGPLFAKKNDGSLRVLSTKSNVEQGDTLVSEKDTYARIKFIDNSEITLKPNSQLKIDSFSFDEAKPAEDNFALSLIKGGLRSITGLLGKRNNARFALKTPNATIGIRGTTFIAEYVTETETAVASMAQYRHASLAAIGPSLLNSSLATVTTNDAPLELLMLRDMVPLQLALTTPVPGAKSPGLYVQVLDGMIHLTNGGGSQSFAAGQFGFTPSFTQPPVVLPANPGMQFIPPPSFSSSTAPNSGASNSGSAKSVDCEVR